MAIIRWQRCAALQPEASFQSEAADVTSQREQAACWGARAGQRGRRVRATDVLLTDDRAPVLLQRRLENQTSAGNAKVILTSIAINYSHICGGSQKAARRRFHTRQTAMHFAGGEWSEPGYYPAFDPAVVVN